MKIEELLTKANNLPLLPGVYIMLSADSEVIYVGKAKALKNRVTSYFRGGHEPKTEAMVEKVSDFNVIVTASEFESLVLENSLIKRHMPRYNILLKDGKGYPLVRLDITETYPRFKMLGKAQKDKARYFGPYGGRGVTKDILDTVSRVLKLPICERLFPRDFAKERPCLHYHMKYCEGWCRGLGDETDYKERIRQAAMFLEGRGEELTKELTERMEAAAEELRFELAAEIRDRIKSVTRLQNRQSVVSAVLADTDAIGWYRGAKCCFTVLHYRDGELAGKDFELMDEPLEDDSETLTALLSQYYARRSAWPKAILLPFAPSDIDALTELFCSMAGRKLSLSVPERGDRLRLVEAAALNAREESIRTTDAAERRSKTIKWLQSALELQTEPIRIEAFDISNTGNFGIVAAMTVFVNGRALKRGYRKFKIGKEENANLRQDDYGAMREALSRRFKRFKEGDEKFGELPDLLLIDGGANHAKIATDVLAELEINLPVFGMVKDARHRTRALIRADGCEIGISGTPAIFALIGTIQEETHRFAIEYHRSLRAAGIGSTLDNIVGVGEKRRNELLKHFKTIKAIKTASLEELSAVVPKNTARAVFEHFQHSISEEKEAKRL